MLDFLAMHVLQRPIGTVHRLNSGELFILKKNSREATCKLLSHQFGWELQLFVGRQLEVVQSHVCRTQDEVLDTYEHWKGALIEKGWA